MISRKIDSASGLQSNGSLNFVPRPRTLRMNAERRIGYVFVFSAPKSFSIVEAMATETDRQAMLLAFDKPAASMDTMEYS